MEDLAARYNSNKPWHFQLQLPVRNSRVGGCVVGLLDQLKIKLTSVPVGLKLGTELDNILLHGMY